LVNIYGPSTPDTECVAAKGTDGKIRKRGEEGLVVRSKFEAEHAQIRKG
jgi:hypothetical protein